MIEDKVIIFRNPTNDSVCMMRVINDEFLRVSNAYGVTEDQFITTQINNFLKQDKYKHFKAFVKNKSEVSAMLNNDPSKKVEKLRCDNSGTLSMDLTFKTKDEILKEKKVLIRTKLKTGVPLTDEDVDILLK